MAFPGQEDELRGSNPNYLAVVVEYEEGDGDLAGVDVKESSTGSDEWRAMQQSWGAVWKLDAGSELQPPLDLPILGPETSGAQDVIPDGWQPGVNYL
ncbi:Expansin-B15 [Morella rubra]|uniref:Expansin-B15 n=1 Tax=Morella rubra TaxID=262757 RepID=A0A6A1UWW8_9ROSI|nr:Expansin-B15 [Morella rubra]